MMPGMDGIEATRIIRRDIGTDYAKTVPILALTANAILGNEEMFLSNGFQAFLSKPIDILAMDAAIRQWVRDKSVESALEMDIASSAVEAQSDAPDASESDVNIDGLDYKKGLERFGGDEDVYIEILKSYVNNTPQLLEQSQGVTADTLAEYAVVVHGIKGSSRNIGAEALGDLAESLEHEAKDGNYAFIVEHNENFVKAAHTLLGGLQALIKSFDDAHPRQVKSAPDKDTLTALRDACVAFDIDGVDRAMGELEGFEYESGGELVKWLREQVDIMGFKQIAERLTKEL
jgi:HPt (histidine-containing phosphotransfer) domain-containing protein